MVKKNHVLSMVEVLRFKTLISTLWFYFLPKTYKWPFMNRSNLLKWQKNFNPWNDFWIWNYCCYLKFQKYIYLAFHWGIKTKIWFYCTSLKNCDSDSIFQMLEQSFRWTWAKLFFLFWQTWICKTKKTSSKKWHI